MAWALLLRAFWISPGVHSMLLISPSKLWARIFLVNRCSPTLPAFGWWQRVLQFCGGAVQG